VRAAPACFHGAANQVSLFYDAQEIASLLKRRLRTDNPHKQWLAVKLLERVMQSCTAVLASCQEELLQEVAQVMARPAKPGSDAGEP
jgi:hypothetical protein